MKTSQSPSQRTLKWILELEEYDATYYYRPGSLNVQADVLSRVSEKWEDEVAISWYMRNKSIDQLKREQLKTLTDKPTLNTNSSSEDDITIMHIKETDIQYSIINDEVDKQMLTEAQWQDDNVQSMIKYLKSGSKSNTIQSFKQDSQGTLYLIDKIRHLWRLIVPKIYVEHILRGCHDDIGGSHLGRTKTLNKIAQRFYWIGMSKDVKNWVLSCAKCCARKSSRSKTEPEQIPLPIVENPFDRVSVDFVGPCPLTDNGNRYILVFVDYATRWPEAFATKNMTARTVAEIFVMEILCRHGAPVQLLSDQGRDFLATVVSEICMFTRTHKIQTASYHPQTNGLCERFNGTICQALSAYCNANQTNWDVMLPIALFGCRTSTQLSTQSTPAGLLYARELRLPMNLDLYMPKLPYPNKIKDEWRRAQESIKDVTLSNKARHDLKNKPHLYREGDMVRLRIQTVGKGLSRKFADKWSSPTKLLKVKNNNVLVTSNNKLKYINQVHIKPAEPSRKSLGFRSN